DQARFEPLALRLRTVEGLGPGEARALGVDPGGDEADHLRTAGLLAPGAGLALTEKGMFLHGEGGARGSRGGGPHPNPRPPGNAGHAAAATGPDTNAPTTGSRRPGRLRQCPYATPNAQRHTGFPADVTLNRRTPPAVVGDRGVRIPTGRRAHG